LLGLEQFLQQSFKGWDLCTIVCWCENGRYDKTEESTNSYCSRK